MTQEREPFDGRKEKEEARRKDQEGHNSEKGDSQKYLMLFHVKNACFATIATQINMLICD